MYENKMGAWQAYKLYWKNAFNYKGRARRAEYWWPNLFNYIISLLLQLLMYIVGGVLVAAVGNSGDNGNAFIPVMLLYILILLFGLATFFPSLSVQVRRLHDRGYSGWIYLGIIIASILILVVTFVGVSVSMGSSEQFTSVQGIILFIGFVLVFIANLWLFIQNVSDSKPEANKWGPNPKKVDQPHINTQEQSIYQL